MKKTYTTLCLMVFIMVLALTFLFPPVTYSQEAAAILKEQCLKKAGTASANACAYVAESLGVYKAQLLLECNKRCSSQAGKSVLVCQNLCKFYYK